MFKLGMKGSIGVIIGSIAIVLILFGINSANNISEQNQTFLNLQVGKETALGTENLIRMLDKATSKVIYGVVTADPDSTCAYTFDGDFQTEYENVIADFIVATSSPLECIVTQDAIGSINVDGDTVMTITGILDCSIQLEEFRATDVRPFRFEKVIIETPNPPPVPSDCSVVDTSSGCTEQPGFSC